MNLTVLRSTVLTFAAVVGIHSLTLAQTKKLDKKLRKEQNKEYKTKMKWFKKEGMKITGTSRSLEVALLTHYDKLNKGYEEIQVITKNCPTMNLCARKALTDACSEYATLANSFLRGKVTSELGMDATKTENQAEQDRFYAAYEQKVSANLAGVLKKSFAAYKEEGKKNNQSYTYESYYLVESEAAKSARQKAMEQALAETKTSTAWGNKISAFINEKPEKTE